MSRVCRYFFPLLLLLSFVAHEARAQESNKYKNFPVPFGPTNTGRDFWMAFPANWDEPSSAKYYIRLYITSGVKTQVRIWTGKTIRKIITTKPYDIVTVDLSPVEAQMFTRRDTDPIPADQIYKKKAVRVEADAPIVVYGMNRTSYTSDGMLMMPTNGLGRQYIIASYAAVIGVTQELPSQFMIIAPYNGTQVTVKQPMRSPNHPEGSTVSFTLDSGDVYSAMSVGYNGDMSGAEISASKPVAVTAGQNCAYIPNQLEFCCCDHIEEMMLPVSAWGKIYHGVSFETRKNGDIWRIYASQPNTQIYLNGSPFAKLNEVGGQRGDGWVEYRAIGRELNEWTADKPFYVAQYNASQYYDNVVSDPFYLVLTPLEQYQTALTFATPSNDFPRNFINLVADSAGYLDIEMAPGGTENWTKISTYPGTGSTKTFKTRIGGKAFVGVTIDIKPGTYRMRGTSPFAGYLYGFSDFDSYGYPLSVATGNLLTRDSIPPTITKVADCSGNVKITTTDQPNDAAIRTNIATIEMDPDSSFNYDIVVDYFESGVTRTVNYTLKVRNKNQAARAIVYISDAAGNMTTDTVNYAPTLLTITPSPVEYGPMMIGASDTKKLMITNRSEREVRISEALLQKGNTGFTLVSPVGEFVLGPIGSTTASVEAEVKFTATAEGTFTDSVGLRDECGLRYLALVRATVAQPGIDVSDWDFKEVPVGTYGDHTITVRNTAAVGGGVLTVTGASGPSTAEFTLPDGMLAFPFTLAPQASRTLMVRFTPPAVQSYSDQIVFESNAPSGDNIGLLTGKGIQPAIFATSKSWTAERVGTGPYPGTIYIKNAGTQSATINGIAGTPTGNTADFRIVNLTDVQGKVLNPGDSVIVNVEFLPQDVNTRKLTINWDVFPTQENMPVSTLEGFGVRPLLSTSDVDFGSMNIDDPAVTKSVRFWLPLEQDFIDSVNITGLQFVTVSANGNDDYTSVPLTTAVVLKPTGQTELVISGSFIARAAGTRVASVRAITTDGVDTTSHWTGVGISIDDPSSITGTGASVQGICVGSDGTLTATIFNNGSVPDTVTGLTTSDPRFVVVSPLTPLILASAETQNVVIRYTPTGSGTVNATLSVANSSQIPQLDLAISGQAIADTIRGQVVLANGDTHVGLGKDVMASVVVGNLPAGQVLKNYQVTFTYNATDLVPKTGTGMITVPSGTATVDAGSTPGTLVVNVALNSALSGAGEVIKLPMGVLFNTVTTRSVNATVKFTDGQCLTTLITGDTVEVDPICGLSLRLIEMTGSNFTLDQNKPNPFNPVTKITYSLGLDGTTQIYLFDAKGTMVQKLVDEYQQPGKYELTLDVSNLPSGNYYYKLVSGTWSETKMLTVVK